ncbi:MAG: tRNA lysidine(34) synthetase TilS [Saccharospirillum sp.]|uniref:tRNA lysidine(34) synthetase TilS n=1 Tax=Saccharospirillum sp. TaxID=2033801 RepID=UPI0034A03C9E
MTQPEYPTFHRFDDWLAEHALRPVFVGYSGGVDSHLVLHELCARLPASDVVAVHVNHGLSPRAGAWQAHCEQQCRQLGCGFEAYPVEVTASGDGLEAAARQERYRIFLHQVPPGHSLWLGHHLDDQLETFLLRLLRGSGLTGLSAMADEVSREDRYLLRPLLTTSREQIEARANQLGLHWIEDDSNDDVRFDRNFLRQEVLPLIASRWPQYRQTLARSLGHLDQAARQQHRQLDGELERRLAHDGALKVVQMDDWPAEQVQALIHRWLYRQNVRSPSETALQRIVSEVVNARVDAQPEVTFGNGSVRRFRTALYWVPNTEELSSPPGDVSEDWQHWPGVGWLRVRHVGDGPGRIRGEPATWRWQLRQGGESLWPAGRSARRDLKRLLQEYRLPPWQRDRVPLLFAGDQLVAVANLAIDVGWQANPAEPGWAVDWQPSRPPTSNRSQSDDGVD